MIALYQLSGARSAEGNPIVKWQGPDQINHYLDVSNPADPDQWVIGHDNNGKPVIAYKPGEEGEDGTLVISLDGAPSQIATLLHEEDDFPRKYYFATDAWNNNPLRRPAFILRCEGINTCPVLPWTNFRVMVVEP